MWRDIARRAEMHGIPARLPAPYPVVASGRANLVAIIGMREGWSVDYVRAAYRRWFQHGEENGGDANLTTSLREVGQDPARVLVLADGDDAKLIMTAETDVARSLGIFGSPTFTRRP